MNDEARLENLAKRLGAAAAERLDVAAAAPEYDGLLRELDSLRERVASLERERDELRRLLHASERRAEPARRAAEETPPTSRVAALARPAGGDPRPSRGIA